MRISAQKFMLWHLKAEWIKVEEIYKSHGITKTFEEWLESHDLLEDE